VTAAVITGAAGDLGQALTETFLSDGHRVYGGDIVPVEPRPGLVPVHLDVTDRAAVLALAERAAAEAGPLKLWINAAGVLRVVKVLEAELVDWERIIAVNLTGTFNGCAAALEVMRRTGGGRIVNIGSLSGQVGGTALHPAYGASKAGVHALTKTYALEGARYGVYCNAVAPSVIEGAMADQMSASASISAAPTRSAALPACRRWSTPCGIWRATPRATPTA
jgi:NAD(P)-dependent dehydrogenase (short-subunit alcohol dehydrogenase family)